MLPSVSSNSNLYYSHSLLIIAIYTVAWLLAAAKATQRGHVASVSRRAGGDSNP
eukprot:m.87478 g.87478  ORF g.87478 m.87478 type:complete len:54 (-) comp11562_c0_seq1:1539-1700(-)